MNAGPDETPRPKSGWIKALTSVTHQLASLPESAYPLIPSHAAIHRQARAPVSRVEHRRALSADAVRRAASRLLPAPAAYAAEWQTAAW